jgi:hypothetical protein
MSFRRASLHKPGWNGELRQGLNDLNREFNTLDSNAENYTGSDPPPIWRRDVVVPDGAKITGGHGDDVRLRKGAHVEVAVTAEPIICSRTS